MLKKAIYVAIILLCGAIQATAQVSADRCDLSGRYDCNGCDARLVPGAPDTYIVSDPGVGGNTIMTPAKGVPDEWETQAKPPWPHWIAKAIENCTGIDFGPGKWHLKH